ncbi:MAG: hypothetical protein HYS18_05035 [Burkholderiales bacterium]|nr:hypothetical protein [Burkholderiales bacterium]
MQLPRIVAFFLCVISMQSACGGLMNSSASPFSTTQGVSLARTGIIVDIRENKEISVKFENARVELYPLDSTAGFHVGDTVKVIENRGRVQLLRQ